MTLLPHYRKWCADIQYPGAKTARFGTVCCDDDDDETAVREKVRRQALEHIPDGFAIVRLIPGSLLFVPG